MPEEQPIGFKSGLVAWIALMRDTVCLKAAHAYLNQGVLRDADYVAVGIIRIWTHGRLLIRMDGVLWSVQRIPW